MFVQEKKAQTSGQARIVVGPWQCSVHGDVPTQKLLEELSYRDIKIAQFMRTGVWADQIQKEFEEALAKQHNIVPIGGRFRGRNEMATGATTEYRNTREFKRIVRDASTVYFFDLGTKTFPTTLLKRVLQLMKDAGIRFELRRDYETPEPEFPFFYDALDHERREYQNRAVDAVLHSRHGIIALATNAGKTTVMMRAIQRRGIKTLVLVQRTELLGQMADEFQKHMYEEVGQVGGGKMTLNPITVGVINSVDNHIDTIQKYGFKQVFVDEGHHGASKTHFCVIQKIKPWACYALTGTDFRTKRAENLVLEAAFGRTQIRITNQYMTEHGYSAELEAEIIDNEVLLDKKLNWSRVYRQAVVNHGPRTDAIVDKVIAHVEQGHTVLIMVEQILHGQLIHGALQRLGVDSRFMHGNSGEQERELARLEFRDRKFPVLVGTVYDEGVDFPTLDVVVLAGGKKAKIKVLQRLGRGQRRGTTGNGKKDKAWVIDCYDHGHKYLKDHSLRRLSAMLGAGVDVPRQYVSLLRKEGFV